MYKFFMKKKITWHSIRFSYNSVKIHFLIKLKVALENFLPYCVLCRKELGNGKGSSFCKVWLLRNFVPYYVILSNRSIADMMTNRHAS